MNGDPKSKRLEAYASLRQNGDIQFSDDEMEKLLANEADRKSFHQYLGNQYGDAGSYEEWEASWFPEYSKKKDYGVGGEPSSASSSATKLAEAVTDFSAFAEPTDKSPVQDKGVPVIPADAAIQEEVEPYPIEDFGMARERQPVGSMDTIEKYQDEILKREQSYIKAIEETPSVVLSDPRQAFDLLATDESTKKLHNDPDASDYMKGRLKAQVITDATNLLGGRLAMIEGALRPQDLERYTNAKSALIQIYESGDPNMVVDGRNGAEWMDEWDSMLQSNEDLFEYDALLIKMHDLGASFEGIKDVNPAYFKELEKARNRQFMSDLDFKVNYNGVLKYPRLAGVAATAQVKSWAQGFMGFVASVGNSYNSAAERYDWADKLAEKAARMDWGHGSVVPTFAQRDIFTHVAKVGGYQVDIDSNGGVLAVRDSKGYIVDDPKLSSQIVEQYESAPDKYDAKFRPHFAPAVNAAAQGVVQIAITSRFAGVGRTAAAAKGWAAGALTAQMAGQNYIQALEEFGPQNADVAARFSIAVAALQAGISMYVNPLEIKLNPRFNISPKTFKAVAADLASGKSKDAVIRNGFRAYSSDMAKGLLAYTKEVGKEGMEGLMEHAVEIGGRKLVRSVTEVNAEYDASAGAAVNAFVSELVGSSLAAGTAIDTRASWQKESMLIAYENRAEILPMVEKMHGAEVAAKLKLALDAADKRMRGQKLTREQKNAVVTQEYNKATKIDEEEAAPTPATQPEPAVQPQAEPEAEPVVETSKEVIPAPTVYDVAREEAIALRLEAGDSHKGSDGTQYTVVEEGDQTVTLRNEDDGRTFQRNKEELRKEIMTLYNQTYATAFPEMDFNQIGSIRRGMWDQASQGVLGLPSPAPVAAQPSQDVDDDVRFTESADLNQIYAAAKQKYGDKDGRKYIEAADRLVNPNQNKIIAIRSNGVVVKEGGRYLFKGFTNTDASYKKWTLSSRPIDVTDQYTEQTIAPEAQAPALAPAPTQETQAAPAEQQVAAEKVSPVAPLVYNRSNIEQAEGIDTAAIATALDVVSEIVPDMQVQVFETQAEMEATLGQRGNAFVSQDGKTIYISKESNAIDVQHEVIHPIMVAAELRNPGTIDLFYDQIMNKLPERVRDDLEVFQLGYAGKSQQEQREEVVVEFLARLASGQYEMTVFKQEGVLDAIIGWFDAIFVKLGITNPPNNLTDIKSFSRKIVEAFRTRAAIAFDRDVESTVTTETETLPYTNNQEWLEWVAQDSNDPVEVAEAYITSWGIDVKPPELGYKDRIIIDEGLDKMSQADWDRHLDPNWLKGDPGNRKKYIGRDVTDIDVRVESISAQYGIEITIDDVVDFVSRDMGGSVDRRKAGETSQLTKDIAGRYGTLTGKRMTIATARKVIKDKLKAIDEQYEKYLIEDGKTQEELEAAYFKAIKDGKIPAPPDLNARVGTTEGVSEDLKARFTEADLTGVFEDAGYHGGNLSEKSDYLEPGYRGQQPFTGYYFYSKPADAIERGNRKTGEKDVRVVNFSKYNLLKPTTVQYWAIDAGLKKIEDVLRAGKLPSRERSDVMSMFKDSAPTVYNEIIGIEGRLPRLFEQWRKQVEGGGKVERFETVLLKELGYEGVDVRGLTEAAGLANPDSRFQGSVIFDLKPGTVYDPSTGKLDDGTTLKARFTQDTLDPQYFRAKKWMRDEMNQTPPRLRDAIINDAIGIFGINRGQAEIMYDVLWRSPDMKRMLIPPGVQTNRTGLAGMLDKAQQFRNEWLLKSQGMPMEVLRGLESALGENELLVRRMMESYGRVMKIIDKQPKDQRRDLRELANRFLDGRISDAQIASMPPPLYAELRQMRSRIDEVSAEILNDANLSEMRTEIIGANMGEYIGRFFRVHLFGKYSPEKASIKKFMDEYRRRNYDAVAIANPTWTADQIEAELRYKGEQAYKDLLQKHAIDPNTGGQRTSKISKPTGMMKEREQLPKRAGDLWEAIDEQRWGPMTLPPAPGPVGNTGNPEFEAAFNAAWNDMRQYRLREAYFVHKELSKKFKDLEKVGEKLAKLTHSVGFLLTGTNPFSKENIRMAVENRTPFAFASLPPSATPAQVQQFNDLLNELNDGIVDISNRVRDRVNLDMDSIMANKNELDGTDGFRDLEHLTPGVRAILGEIAPLEATVITMANMARYYTMNKYYRMIRALGEGNFLFRADDPNRPTWVNKRIPGREQAVGMVPPDATTEKMAPLSGLYTTPEIYDILMNVEHFNEGVGMPGLWTSTGLFAKFSGKVQEWKTIFSPQTQARNFLSNLFFVVRNAWADPVRMTLGFAYVPIDYLLMRTTGRRISTKDVGYLAPLKQMSDALSFSIAQNFGDNVGSDVTKPMDAAKYGFDPTVASDLSNFHAAKRAMEAGMKRQETRTSLVTDAVNNYGMSEDNARRLYADLQPTSFKHHMGDILNKLAANGVIGTSINMRIIQSYMGEVDTADKAAAYIANAIVYEEASPFMRAVRIGQKNWKDFNSIFGKLYSFGDDTFKIFGYLRERGQYSNLLFNKDYFLLSDEQQAEVDNIAMENVKNIIPNYDRIGKLGKWFSRDPFFAQFIAFKIESMRVWYNLFSLANKEIRDGKASGNAAMVRHGYTRLASHVSMIGVTTAAEIGLTKFLGGTLAQGLQFIGNYISAFDDDEEEKEKKKALRDPLPDWMQNDVLAISNPVDGKVTYISVSANHPFGDFQRTLVEFSETTQINLTEQPYGVQLGVVAVKELFEQFWQTKIATAVLIEIVSNKDSYGREIWNKATKDYEGDTDGVMFQKILSYAMRRAGPAWIGQASRVGWLDWLPENEFFADFRKPVHAASKTEEIAAMITGFKPITIDFYDQFKRRVGDFANYPGTQDKIYGKVQHWNLRIDDATFESQIKRMVEEEYATLASLHDAYRLPVKHGIVTAEKMNEVLTNDRKEGGVGLSGNLYNKNGTVNNNGRLTHMIAYGTYSAPWDKINDLIAKRKDKKPDYQPTPELDQWIRNFQMDKQQDENR